MKTSCVDKNVVTARFLRDYLDYIVLSADLFNEGLHEIDKGVGEVVGEGNKDREADDRADDEYKLCWLCEIDRCRSVVMLKWNVEFCGLYIEGNSLFNSGIVLRDRRICWCFGGCFLLFACF